ncbi:MAG TPA: hypothetical protein VMB73_11780 [Acetobacteraceae bacterium]|jgi:hypothetical protein|nr:hypothetical protein [Acetobacteraceae bacterium]
MRALLAGHQGYIGTVMTPDFAGPRYQRTSHIKRPLDHGSLDASLRHVTALQTAPQ